MGRAMALISCAECQKTISDKAASCPHCGAPRNTLKTPPVPSPNQKQKSVNRQFGKFLLSSVLVFGAMAFVASLFNDQNTPSATTVTADVRSGIISGKPTEVVQVTAAGLFQEYDNNEVATDNRLRGKIVEVTGTVASINKDFLDHVYVNLATQNQFMSASMHVPQSEEQKMASLRKGQKVVFRCPKMQRWVGSPSGGDCVLMRSD